MSDVSMKYRYTNKKLMLLAILAASIISTQPAYSETWKSLGQRWAITTDENGAATAIYDLSYPTHIDPIPLGSLGESKLSARQIIAVLDQAKPESMEEDASKKEVLSELSRRSNDEINESVFPQNWWTQVKWKSQRSFSMAAAPAAFALGELDLHAMTKNKKKLNEKLGKVAQLWSELRQSNPDLGEDVLSQLILRANSTGGYELSVTPMGSNRLKKIADLKNSKWGFGEALKWELIEQAVDQLAGLITAPIASAIIETALDRFFHFHKLARRAHENMVLEFLADIDRGGGAFPADSLSAAEKTRAIESLAYAQFSLITGWKWAWKKPAEEFRKQLGKEEDYSKKSTDWLDDNSFEVTLLSSRFGSVQSRDGFEQLRLLSLSKLDKKKGPTVSYDSADPDKIFRHRLTMEIVNTGVVFGSNFIPVIGGKLKWLYKRLVEKPMDKTKAWEARLTAHLEQRSAVSGESWTRELEVLDHQRVNPLMLSRQKTFELVRARKEKLGLTH